MGIWLLDGLCHGHEVVLYRRDALVVQHWRLAALWLILLLLVIFGFNLLLLVCWCYTTPLFSPDLDRLGALFLRGHRKLRCQAIMHCHRRSISTRARPLFLLTPPRLLLILVFLVITLKAERKVCRLELADLVRYYVQGLIVRMLLSC